MKSRRSGFSLVLIGLLGAAFFWLTDPKYGVRWLNLRPGENPVDATHGGVVGGVNRVFTRPQVQPADAVLRVGQPKEGRTQEADQDEAETRTTTLHISVTSATPSS